MSDCPCGSGVSYEDCCQPIISGTKDAPTAEALMRSRYTAFAKVEIEHLCESLHPEHRDDFDAKAAEKWARESEWLGLDVIKTVDGGEDDKEGVVEFTAKYTDRGQQIDHHEVARFERAEGKWYFVAGRIVQDTYRREGPKIGRNEPCPCGSGKKYKKCCG